MGWKAIALVFLLSGALGSSESLATAGLRGRIFDLAHRPVPSAKIQLQARRSAQTIRTVYGNKSGDYEIAGLRPGVYRLQLSAGNLSEVSVAHIRLSAHESRWIPDLELNFSNLPYDDCSRGEPYRSFELADTSRSEGGLTSIVRDATGDPVANAAVVVSAPGAGKTRVTTNVHGVLKVTGLKPRPDYLLQVSHAGFFTENTTRLRVQAGFISELLPIALERCKPGLCQPFLKEVRVLPGCS